MNKKGFATILIIIFILILLIGFGIINLGALLGNQAQELTDITNQNCVALDKICEYESYLKGFSADNVTFQVGLMGGAGDACSSINAELYIFNYKTSNYEKIWVFAGSTGARASFNFNNINKKTIIAQQFTGGRDSYGNANAINYYACQKSQSSEGVCVYPSECISTIPANSNRENIACVREKYLFNSNYIKDKILKFKAILSSSGHYSCPSTYDAIEVGYSDWTISPEDRQTSITPIPANPTEVNILNPVFSQQEENIFTRIINWIKNLFKI